MKMLPWAVGVLGLEILLFWGYFSLGGRQMISRNVALASLVVTVSVIVWLGYNSGFGQTLKRLLLAVVGCIILTYAALVVAFLVDLPTAFVCERGRTDVEATPTIAGGRFEERHVGPCVFYNPEGRLAESSRGGD